MGKHRQPLTEVPGEKPKHFKARYIPWAYKKRAASPERVLSDEELREAIRRIMNARK